MNMANLFTFSCVPGKFYVCVFHFYLSYNIFSSFSKIRIPLLIVKRDGQHLDIMNIVLNIILMNTCLSYCTMC